MILKPITPKLALLPTGDDIDSASLVSILNQADDGGATPALIPIQIRINNGAQLNDQPTIAIAAGERVVIEKKPTDDLIPETLAGGGILSGAVYATKIAFTN